MSDCSKVITDFLFQNFYNLAVLKRAYMLLAFALASSQQKKEEASLQVDNTNSKGFSIILQSISWQQGPNFLGTSVGQNEGWYTT